MMQASKARTRFFAAAAALGVAVAAVVVVARAPRAGAKASSNVSMLRGAEYLGELDARLRHATFSSTEAVRTDALQAVYLARVRTGLGSPFRVIEAALRDPWLPDSVRPALASAMLVSAMTIAPNASRLQAIDGSRALIVDSVVRSHPEPRRGEEVVRVAFHLAAASGAISAGEAAAAVELAAVSRDAVYTRRDIARLIAAAHRAGLTPLALLPLWREERRFEVEKPIVYPIEWAASRELVWNAARLFERLDNSTAAPADSAPVEFVAPAIRDAARRLARERGAPPSPAILQIAGPTSGSRAVAPATEEELAAAWLSATTESAAERRVWGRTMISAAVRLRTSAQDPIWFAGDPAPTVLELQQRHGLRAVTFAELPSPAWRGYALLSLDRALTDARRVLPELDLRGLRIHVGMKPEWPARAMALHDPETRTIYFPLGTAPGVLAHELGHDLDWQVARTVFGEQGIYATDGTARRESNILAAPVERLTGASALRARGPSRGAVAARPTEVLARHVDWVLAAALATQGRSNGFLSTVQESGDALGNTAAPKLELIDAAVSVLAPAIRVPQRTVDDVHARSSATLVRDVIGRALSANVRMPWTRRANPVFDALGNAPAMFRAAADPRAARACLAAFTRASGEPDWVGDAVALAADARSRDVLRRMRQTSPRRPGMRDALLRAGLYAGPVDPHLRARSVAAVRREIEWQLATALLAPLAQASQSGGPLRCD